MNRPDAVQVCLDLGEPDGPLVMGTLRRQPSRSGETFSFEYEPEWLGRHTAFAHDPDLALVSGPQYPPPGRTLFGVFLDSAPDRWGRVLMQRRERLQARHEGRRPRHLTEWDFLLGVNDETRLGAIRLRAESGGDYLDSGERLAAPPLASLRELQTASLLLEEHPDEEAHPEYERWLSQLFAPGSSLGGARPKASVRDETGALCLAKLPSRQDSRDVGAWELVAHRLAARAGIGVPASRAIRLAGSPHTTFLAKRFDRTTSGGRLAFVSAMTLTQRVDGEAGASYLELVDLLQSHGTSTAADCKELFRRVVFNVLVHNTDDHLRNHGFFVGPDGLRLAPAYDLNPSIERSELSLAIDEVDAACDVSIALRACRDYGLPRSEAEVVVEQVRLAVGAWRGEAAALGIPRAEQELMARAFVT